MLSLMYEKVKEHRFGLMEIDMMGFGRMTRLMGSDDSYMLMETIMKDSG